MEIIKHNPQTAIGQVRIKFLAVVRQFIKAAENGEILTKEGNHYASGTMRTYRTFLLTIEGYEEKFGTVYLEDINVMWAEYYRVFLTQAGMRKNTIATNMSRLKAILNRAYMVGITNRTGYGIRISKEKTIQVYLTWNDLKTLYNHEFKNEGERRIRDVFVMHCFIGMRISDYLHFIQSPKDYISNVDGKELIQYFSQKTGTKSVVPVHKMVKIILEKNHYDFGKPFSYQHYNYYLKKIAKIADLTDSVRVICTEGGNRVERAIGKYRKISSHTARRTFASLAELAKIDRPSIMKITGHLTEQSLLRYIRISELDSALKIFDHEFFTREL